jgi:hypothetical protein
MFPMDRDVNARARWMPGRAVDLQSVAETLRAWGEASREWYHRQAWQTSFRFRRLLASAEIRIGAARVRPVRFFPPSLRYGSAN